MGYKNKAHKQFTRRNKNLRKLGFSSYREYLQSDLWKTIRINTLIRNKYKCRYCLKYASQVHHLGYTISVLNGSRNFNLVAVCAMCHAKISEIVAERKIGQEEATEIFKKSCTLRLA